MFDRNTAITVCHDGETNWFEGAMLLALYLILAVALYHAEPVP